jgi:undecaprenyl diphosphate synthase
MSEDLLREYLWTSELGCSGPGALDNVDLVIRTSGEMRISNFLLYQAAYAEFHFTPVCWPDFTPEHFKAAIEDFSARDRRFGGVKAKSRPEEGTAVV